MKERKRVRLEDMPNGIGQQYQVLAALLIVLSIAFLTCGALFVVGTIGKPVSEPQWQLQQEEAAAETYDEYAQARENEVDQIGVIAMIGAPILALCAASLLWTGQYTYCQNGHVSRKDFSYCWKCGAKVYTEDELSPDEWKKRYG